MRSSRLKKKSSGFTLVEVVITMVLLSLMSLGVFVGLQQITLAMMSVAVRDEAYHLMQAEAERLLATDYSSFSSVGNQTITSAVKTSYTPSAAARFALSSPDALGRVTYTRRVVSVSSTSTSKTLRVEVEWTFNQRPAQISTVLYRLQ